MFSPPPQQEWIEIYSTWNKVDSGIRVIIEIAIAIVGGRDCDCAIAISIAIEGYAGLELAISPSNVYKWEMMISACRHNGIQ